MSEKGLRRAIWATLWVTGALALGAWAVPAWEEVLVRAQLLVLGMEIAWWIVYLRAYPPAAGRREEEG